MQIKKKINPIDVKKKKDAASETRAKKARAALELKPELDKDPVRMAAYLANALTEDLEHYSGLRLPDRPIIEVEADESPLNTKFSELFAEARRTTAECVAMLEDNPGSYMDERFTELTKSFYRIVREIKTDASSSTEASMALVELFNFLTAHEKFNVDCGYRLSCNIVGELISIPGVDLELLDNVILAYVPSEIAEWHPFEMMNFDGLKPLFTRYIEDVSSGEPKRVERAKAWAEVLELTDKEIREFEGIDESSAATEPWEGKALRGMIEEGIRALECSEERTSPVTDEERRKAQENHERAQKALLNLGPSEQFDQLPEHMSEAEVREVGLRQWKELALSLNEESQASIKKKLGKDVADASPEELRRFLTQTMWTRAFE